MPQDNLDVLAVNAAFYRAFATCDSDAMDGLWAEREAVACVHPGWQALHGRDAVMASWRVVHHHAGPIVRTRDGGADDPPPLRT